ncbi:unnamed protein product [Symbiodinium microadriaticum]|nr:unnamed protein product [Symbiodinium microadriaticum]
MQCEVVKRKVFGFRPQVDHMGACLQLDGHGTYFEQALSHAGPPRRRQAVLGSERDDCMMRDFSQASCLLHPLYARMPDVSFLANTSQPPVCPLGPPQRALRAQRSLRCPDTHINRSGSGIVQRK